MKSPLRTRLLLASTLTVLGILGGPIHAQPYRGSKANVTLALTTTTEVGGFLVNNSHLEANAAKRVTFEYAMNPIGVSFNEESNGSNSYALRVTERIRNFGPADDAVPLTTEYIEDYAVRLVPKRMSNAEFIKDLVPRGYASLASTTGYRLVAIFPGESEDGLFFIEKPATKTTPASIIYVGRLAEGDLEATQHDALLVSIGSSVDAINSRFRQVYSHSYVGGEVIVDLDGKATNSETFSSKNLVNVDVFPSSYDEETTDHTSTGISYYVWGRMSASGRYDATSEQYLITSASVSTAAGSYYGSDAYGAVDGGLTISGTSVVTDITPYLDAIPEGLSDLKQSIINAYEAVEESFFGATAVSAATIDNVSISTVAPTP